MIPGLIDRLLPQAHALIPGPKDILIKIQIQQPMGNLSKHQGSGIGLAIGRSIQILNHQRLENL